MGVAYDESGSALVSESEHGIWKAGRRCPDIVLSRPGFPNESRRLYSTLAYGFSIISCGGSLDWSSFDGKIATYRLLSAGEASSEVGSTSGGQASWTFASSEVQPDERFVVVVRPDTYIGYVGTEPGASEYLSRLLGW